MVYHALKIVMYRYLCSSTYGIRTRLNHLEESLKVIKEFSHVGVFERFESSIQKIFLSFDMKLSEKQLTLKINNQNNKVIQNIHSNEKLNMCFYP